MILWKVGATPTRQGSVVKKMSDFTSFFKSGASVVFGTHNVRRNKGTVRVHIGMDRFKRMNDQRNKKSYGSGCLNVRVVGWGRCET